MKYSPIDPNPQIIDSSTDKDVQLVVESDSLFAQEELLINNPD